MARIKREIIKDKDLTVIEVEGKVAVDDITGALKDFYESGFTSKLLWDLSKSDLKDLRGDQLREILFAAKQYSHLRTGGKTALLTMLPLGYGIARMYEILAEVNQYPVANRVFRSMDEAMKWLESD